MDIKFLKRVAFLLILFTELGRVPSVNAAECISGEYFFSEGNNKVQTKLSYACSQPDNGTFYTNIAGGIASVRAGQKGARAAAVLQGLSDTYTGRAQGSTAGVTAIAEQAVLYKAVRTDTSSHGECDVEVKINYSLHTSWPHNTPLTVPTSGLPLFEAWANGVRIIGALGKNNRTAGEFTKLTTIPAGQNESAIFGWSARARIERNESNSQGIGVVGFCVSAHAQFFEPWVEQSDCAVTLEYVPGPNEPPSGGYNNGIDTGSISDSDGDGRPDDTDVFPNIDLGFRVDLDFDGMPGECDSECLLTGMTADFDDDGDGFDDVQDNCPLDYNPGQEDIDNDGAGDACDSVVDPDTDGDGVPDNIDNCISVANPGQEPSSVNASCGEACETAGCFGVMCANH